MSPSFAQPLSCIAIPHRCIGGCLHVAALHLSVGSIQLPRVSSKNLTSAMSSDMDSDLGPAGHFAQ